MDSHNSNVGNFNGDGYPDIVASTYMTDGTYFDPVFFTFGGTSTRDDPLHQQPRRDLHAACDAIHQADQPGILDSPITVGVARPAPSATWMGMARRTSSSSMGRLFPERGITRNDTFLILNITVGNGEAYGDIAKLPAPISRTSPSTPATLPN